MLDISSLRLTFSFLFCNWKIVPLYLSQLFQSSLNALPSGNHPFCSLYLCLLHLLICFGF